MARERRRRRGGSADGSEAQGVPKAPPYIKRKIPHYSILSDEDLSIIEENADTILEEIGIIFSEDQEALDILEKAGASIDGERVRFPKGMCRKLIQDNAPNNLLNMLVILREMLKLVVTIWFWYLLMAPHLFMILTRDDVMQL